MPTAQSNYDNKETQIIKMWSQLGQQLNVAAGGTLPEIFTPTLLAIKELAQGGAVVDGGDDVLIRIYEHYDENVDPPKKEMRLLVANTAKQTADIWDMLNYNNSQGEHASSCNGAGIKVALSYFSPSDETEGNFRVLAKDVNTGEIVYKKSPYGVYMDYYELDRNDWPVPDKYATVIDTGIDIYDKIHDELDADKLAEYIGALFGFRIKDNGLNIRIETPKKVIDRVKPNLPEQIPTESTEMRGRKDRETDAPDVTINNRQHHEIAKYENGEEIINVDIQNAYSESSDGVWRRQMSSQGVYLLQDGIIQTYVGTNSLVGLKPHPSMNGMYTFVDLTGRNGSNLIYKDEKSI